MANILIFSDDAVLACGAAFVLNETADLHFQGVCCDARQLSGTLRAGTTDILLIDLLPEVTLPLISEVRRSFPECRIVLWARDVPHELAYQAMALGIRGVLQRTAPSSELVRCSRKVARNDVWFDDTLTSGFFCNPIVTLTRRERQLVGLLTQGLKNKEIAYKLSLSEGTVKVYLSRLFEKLGVKDRFELALYGLRHLGVGEMPLTVCNTLPRVGAGESISAIPMVAEK